MFTGCFLFWYFNNNQYQVHLVLFVCLCFTRHGLHTSWRTDSPECCCCCCCCFPDFCDVLKINTHRASESLPAPHPPPLFPTYGRRTDSRRTSAVTCGRVGRAPGALRPRQPPVSPEILRPILPTCGHSAVAAAALFIFVERGGSGAREFLMGVAVGRSGRQGGWGGRARWRRSR